ncbi:MAG: hypothetical protein ABSC37_17875 [Xanthobacteraceae bacterium]|jgi:hypothetical protein
MRRDEFAADVGRDLFAFALAGQLVLDKVLGDCRECGLLLALFGLTLALLLGLRVNAALDQREPYFGLLARRLKAQFAVAAESAAGWVWASRIAGQ